MKLDPGIHIAMHSVLSLKLGVTWHEVLSKILWAHRISRHGATKVTPFELVYGQEAVLPVEVNLDAFRLAK